VSRICPLHGAWHLRASVTPSVQYYFAIVGSSVGCCRLKLPLTRRPIIPNGRLLSSVGRRSSLSEPTEVHIRIASVCGQFYFNIKVLLTLTLTRVGPFQEDLGNASARAEASPKPSQPPRVPKLNMQNVAYPSPPAARPKPPPRNPDNSAPSSESPTTTPVSLRENALGEVDTDVPSAVPEDPYAPDAAEYDPFDLTPRTGDVQTSRTVYTTPDKTHREASRSSSAAGITTPPDDESVVEEEEEEDEDEFGPVPTEMENADLYGEDHAIVMQAIRSRWVAELGSIEDPVVTAPNKGGRGPVVNVNPMMQGGAEDEEDEFHETDSHQGYASSNADSIDYQH